MYPKAGYVCCHYERVRVWEISHLEVIFIEGDGYHGPSWPVERYPWGNRVHSPFMVSSGPLAFMFLI